MRNPLLVSTKCRECGGPIRYPEGAYTFRCGFCSSALRTSTEGRELKYIIPARLSRRDILLSVKRLITANRDEYGGLKKVRHIRNIYKPFWYFKGMVYSSWAETVTGKAELLSKLWFHTFQANAEQIPWLFSLGISSEVLALEPYDSARFREEGTVLPVTVSREEAEEHALRIAGRSARIVAPHAPYFRNFLIGERFFILYYPLVQVVCSGEAGLQTVYFDGVTAKFIGGEKGRNSLQAEKEENYHIKFLVHRCKNCGHDLQSADFDLFYYCRHCFRLWELKGGDYHPRKVRLIEPSVKGKTFYIPFWRFAVEIDSPGTGNRFTTVGDLSRFMKMGRHLLRNENPDRPLKFYIPAVVARNARAVMKLATRLSMFQKDVPLSGFSEFPYENILNVSLPEKEAVEMLEPLVFSVIGRADSQAVAFYKDFRVKTLERELVWYPFEDKGAMFVDHYHDYYFPRKSLDIRAF